MDIQLSVTHYSKCHVLDANFLQKLTEILHIFHWIDVNNNTNIVDKQTRRIVYLIWNETVHSVHTPERIILIREQRPKRMTDKSRDICNAEQRDEWKSERERTPISVIVPIIICVCDENYVRPYVFKRRC